MEEETYVPGQLVEEEQETKTAQPVYPAPFGYKFGNSSVDLSIEDNHTTMKDEYEAVSYTHLTLPTTPYV